MDDFANIPAEGDAKVDALEEGLEPEEEVEEDEVGDGKYRFNGKHIYVTWSKSKIDSKEEFHQKLLTILPAGVRMFGGRELHQDGTPHYHVVFSFTEKVHWPDAKKKFSIEGDTNAIRFEKPKPRQRVSGFLEDRMACCAKDGDTFGERLPLEGAVAEQKKRAQRTEAEVQTYREALTAWAGRGGVEVPDFGGEDRELRVEQLREWLGQVLPGPAAVEEHQKPRGGQSRSRGGRRGRGEGRVLSTRGGSKRPRSGKGTERLGSNDR